MQTYPDLWRGFFSDSVVQGEEEKDVILHLDFITFNITQNEGGAKIHGQGKSEEGNFTINGNEKDHNHFICQYKSIKRTIFFAFQLNTEGLKLEGRWGPNIESINPNNVVMIEKIKQYQGWNGYYVQFDIKTQMRFDKFIVEAVPNGKVEAHGSDYCGPFTVKGSFDPATNQIYFVKSYENGVNWDYWGTMKNKELEGQWGWKKPDGEGTFRLYYLN